jgi:hypothetical protein
MGREGDKNTSLSCKEYLHVPVMIMLIIILYFQQETMIRHSKALAVKVKELEEGVTDTFDEGKFRGNFVNFRNDNNRCIPP